MTLPHALTIPADVMARRVGDETVLLHLGNGHYYGLDPVGTRVWQLLSEGLSPAQARETLLGEYDVGPEQLEADMARLLDELRIQGLVQFT